MEINKETNINNQSNNKSDNKNENNIEGEKKVEISRNELNTKSDVNLNINNSFDDFEHKFQELKSKINQERSKDPKINSKFSTTIENLNLKILNDNSESKSKINEIYAMIGGNTLGKLGLIPNKPPEDLNMNTIVKDIKKDNNNFFSKIINNTNNNNNNNNKNNNNNNNNNNKNFDYKNNNFKNINYISPIKSSDYNQNNNNNNYFINKKPYSFSLEKKNPMIYNKKEYVDLFKPLTLKSIKMTSRNYPSNTERIEIQIPKRENFFNKKYFKSELDNFNNLLFGTTSYGKSNDNESNNNFYETKKIYNKRNKFLSEGSSYLNQFSRTKN